MMTPPWPTLDSAVIKQRRELIAGGRGREVEMIRCSLVYPKHGNDTEILVIQILLHYPNISSDERQKGLPSTSILKLLAVKAFSL